MNNAIGWFSGLCCGLPLLAALVLGGASGYWSDPSTFACLTVIALLVGYVAFRFFARRDEDDEWELTSWDRENRAALRRVSAPPGVGLDAKAQARRTYP